MKNLIKFLFFITLSLFIHLAITEILDASNSMKPRYQPVTVTLVQKEQPQEKVITPEPPPPPKPKQKPKPKPKPKPEPEPEPEEPPQPPVEEQAPPVDPQPEQEDLPATPQAADRDLMVNLYQKQILEIIRHNLYYPSSARRRGLEGTVYVRFTIDACGKVNNISVTTPSGYGILDRASLTTIEHCIFPPPPDETLTLSIPITFRLVQDS